MKLNNAWRKGMFKQFRLRGRITSSTFDESGSPASRSAEALAAEGRSVPDVVTAIARPNFQGIAVIVGAMKFHVYDEQASAGGCRRIAVIICGI